MMNEKRKLIGWAVAAVIAFLAGAFLAGCSTSTQIEKEYIHDTIKTTNVVHDSVDRWHTHYEYLKGDTMYLLDSVYFYKNITKHDTIINTKVEYQDRDVEKIVEKKVYVWWPGLALFFFLCALIFGGAALIAKLFDKMEREEDNK